MGCTSNSSINNSNESIEDIERYNQAAGLVLTRNYFIGRTARNCKNLLNENHAYTQSIIVKWNKNNAKHVEAANHWTVHYALDVSLRDGKEKGIRYVGEIMSDYNNNGDIASDALLSMDVVENVNVCHEFLSVVESGKYDLSNSILYPQIIELASLIK